MRYIGSKVLLLDKIKEVIDENVGDKASTFCDIFSGTGTVARYFKEYYQVYSNDIMYFSYILQKATVENNKIPEFNKLKNFGIDDPINYLETFDISGIDFNDEMYFASNNYAPSNRSNRMYLTKENANRIDFIRIKLDEWKRDNIIDDNEYSYLLACLLEGVPYVSNISGTYGAYLKKWDKRALNTIELKKLEVVDNKKDNRCFNEDANELIKKIKGDILYLDPPYNSRQYVPNYHVLETISKYDYPELYGVTGLRNYQDQKSKYCNRKQVKDSFEALIKDSNFKHIIVSYSTDGLMSSDEIEKILKKYGNEETFKMYRIPYRKYKSKHEQKTIELYELIFYINKQSNSIQEYKSKKSEMYKCKINKYKGKQKKKYIKSPLNYIGGKYKLLNQIIPMFPERIETFVDLFAGGFNVGINVEAKNIICNDYNNFVIELFNEFKNNTDEYILNYIEDRIKEFKLTKENEEGFKAFREYYNKTKRPLDLYTLVCYSFNYQFRFNKNFDYNNPFGRNRSQFSSVLKENLIEFLKSMHSKNISFTCKNFIDVSFDNLDKNSFIYCDPPYLITTGSYNDGNRGFKNWTEKEEVMLLEYLDKANEKGIKFALSNVLEHKGKSNNILKEWSKKYNIYHLDHDYSNSSYNTQKGKSEEVLITNY